MHKMCFTISFKFNFMPLHVSSTCAHHQEVKIALHSLWYHHAYRWPSRARNCETNFCIKLVKHWDKLFNWVPLLYYTILYIWVSPSQEFESHVWPKFYDSKNYFYLAVFNMLYDTQMAARILRWLADSSRRKNCTPVS